MQFELWATAMILITINVAYQNRYNLHKTYWEEKTIMAIDKWLPDEDESWGCGGNIKADRCYYNASVTLSVSIIDARVHCVRTAVIKPYMHVWKASL